MRKLTYTILLFSLGLTVGCRQNPDQLSVVQNPQVFVQDSADLNNDFYDNEPFFDLPGPGTILVGGEVEQEVVIDLATLPSRSLLVKETRLEDGEVRFTGAYRYDGPSLFDILREVRVAKKNAGLFRPIIDQYVVVYGADGDSVTLSWGELFYPVHLHQVIVASKVMRIVPSKTGEHWPLPERRKLVVAPDLLTLRNITDPVRIMIRTCDVEIPVDRTVKMWADEMELSISETDRLIFRSLPVGLKPVDFDQVFYGRGMGIHGITTFRGAWLQDLIGGRLQGTPDLIRNGMFVVAAIDGYRCSMTWSELMNRNDAEGVILIDQANYEGAGRFSCLFTADFFSDRAIKSITAIRLIQ